MKSNNLLIGAIVVGGALYLMSRRSGGSLFGGAPGGWGTVLPGRVYDPSLYAGGEPSTAGSDGTGNVSPIAAALGTISNLVKGFAYRQTAASAPTSYGTPASPGALDGPSTKTGVMSPAGIIAAPLNYGSLVDPSGFWQPFQDDWNLFANAAITATPNTIQSQNVSQEFTLGQGIYF